MPQIGVVTESSFQQKWGTPRQGLLVPTAVAQIMLDDVLNLTPGSRVAILWYAHLNGPKFNPLKARIRPPKLDDCSATSTVGVFATRGVHRPSSIGLSFCTIVSVQGVTITIRGGDMIVGTPILSIIPMGSEIEGLRVSMPEWTYRGAAKTSRVEFGLGVIMNLHLQYPEKATVERILDFVGKILSQDPRSVHSLRKHVDPIYEIDLLIEPSIKVWVIYSYREEGIMVWSVSEKRIVGGELRSRTEGWLRRLKEIIPIIGNSY